MKQSIIIFFLCITILGGLFVFAETNAVAGKITIGNVTGKAPDDALEGKAINILGILKWIGYIVAIGMIIFVGIKYLMSGAGVKAKMKETLIPIAIGALLIIATVEIASAVFSMFE